MFKVLTGERKRRAISPATIMASIAAHLLLLGGLVYASTGEATVPGPIETDTIILWDKNNPPPPPSPVIEQPAAPKPADEQPTKAPVPGDVLQVDQVTQVPDSIRPEEPGAEPVNLKDYVGSGPLGDVKGPPPAIHTPPTGTPDPPSPPARNYYPTEDDVDERPVLDRNGLGRALERHYPGLLRDNRVSGRVLIRMIVDENGVPVPGSARVIEASHPAFAQASVRAAERFRFRPARMAGTPVAVEVTIPIVWTAH